MSSRAISPRTTGVPTAPQGCTHLKLRQAGRCLSQHYDAYTASAGLKTTQYSLLAAVMRREPVQPAALAASLNLDASTLTRNLRPLIDHGWIEVLPGPDARSRRVVTTAAGRAVRLEAQRYWREAQQALNERLGVKTVSDLHTLLDRVLAEFAAGDSPEPEPAPKARAATRSKVRPKGRRP
ncbi:MAG: MarR family winged helix-turn-helix transcriptional regulator [Burkholderiaceae bacterium]